jgi:hypothetical protein
MSTKTPIFQHQNADVAKAYDFEEIKDYTEWYDIMLQDGVTLLIYAGEWDTRDGPQTLEDFLRNINALADTDLFEQAKKIYYIPTSDNNTFEVGGYYRSTGNFTLLTVPKSGHFVPTTQL